MFRIIKYTYILFSLTIVLYCIMDIFYPVIIIAQPIRKLAVLPVQDLTHGANGVNFNCTKLLEKNLSKYGIKTIPDKQVMSFLVKHRIRWTGFLDSFNVVLLGKELKTEYVLIGSICQYSNRIEPRIGMTLTLVNTKTASSIWGWVGSLSIKDFIHPLGLYEPKNVSDLLPLLIKKAITDFPNDIKLSKARCISCSIKDVVIHPRFVRSKEPVTCTVRVSSINSNINKFPIVKLYLNNTFIKLKRVSKNEYQATFRAPAIQKSFPIYLIYQVNKKINKLYVGNITVDNKAPKVRLIARGIHIWNAVALKKRLVILPRLDTPEPISRWQIAVCTLDGEKILSQDGPGPLPSRFFWRGQDASGAMVATGVYKIVLDIWDMAGNKATASIKVAVIKTPPRIKVSSKVFKSRLFLTVKNDTDIPLSFWRVEIFKGNSLIDTKMGSKLPVTINFAVPKNKLSRLYCIITARDIFGNTIKKKFTSTFVYSKNKKKLQKKSNNNWVTEF